MKCDVSVSKKFTFNTGNYSSVGPALILTVKDVDVNQIQKVHENLDIIADGLYHKQMISDIQTMGDVKGVGFEKYFGSLDERMMDDEIKKRIEELDI
jgi:hypothetical protein